MIKSRAMIFLKNLGKKIGKHKKLLNYIWVIAFFALHAINTWKLFGLKDIFSFFCILLFTSILIGSVVSSFLMIFSRVKKHGIKLSLPYIILPVLGWLAVIFFVNIDIIFSLDFSRFKFIYASFFNITLPLLITLLFFISAYAIGERMLDFFKSQSFNEMEEFLVAQALGIGFLGYCFFLLSVLHVSYASVAYGLIFLSILISWKNIKKLALSISRKKLEINLEKNNFLEKIVWILLIVSSLAALIYSLADLKSAGWDTFHQYLTFPDAYQKHHGLVYFPFHPHWGFPQLTEMVFLDGLLLGGVRIPFLMNYFFILLGIFGFMQITKNEKGECNIWSVAILASVPFLVIFQAGYLKVEGLFFFFSVMTFLLLKKILSGAASKKPWILLAILLSFLLAVKYTAVFILGGVFVALWFFRKQFVFDWKKFFPMVIVIGIIFSPWLVKNYVYYKSPLYPLFSGQDYSSNKLGTSCHGYFISSCNEDNFLLRDRSLFIKDNQFASNILIALKAFLIGDLFDVTNVGPFIIIFLPAIIGMYFRRKDYYMRFLAVFFLAYFLLGVCFFTGQIWYFLPMIVAYVIIIAYIWEEKTDYFDFVIIKYFILCWLLMVISMFILNAGAKDRIQYIRSETNLEESFSITNKKDTSNKMSALLKMSAYVNGNILPEENSQTIIYGFTDTQGYFFKDSYAHFIPDFYGYLFSCMSQKGEIYDNMKKLGVNYIIFNAATYPKCGGDNVKFFTCRAENDFKIFISKYGKMVHKEGIFELYSLK